MGYLRFSNKLITINMTMNDAAGHLRTSKLTGDRRQPATQRVAPLVPESLCCPCAACQDMDLCPQLSGHPRQDPREDLREDLLTSG